MSNAAGDPHLVAEFDALVAQERRRSLAYAHRATRSFADSEDAVQEASIRAWRAFDRYDRRRPFARWYRVILHHVLADHYRVKRNCEVASDPAAVEQMIDDPGDPEPLPAGLREDVRLALASLPGADRRLIEKRFLQMKTREEIAREEGIGCRTLDKRGKAALARLRVLLEVKAAATDAPGAEQE